MKTLHLLSSLENAECSIKYQKYFHHRQTDMAATTGGEVGATAGATEGVTATETVQMDVVSAGETIGAKKRCGDGEPLEGGTFDARGRKQGMQQMDGVMSRTPAEGQACGEVESGVSQPEETAGLSQEAGNKDSGAFDANRFLCKANKFLD